jgi:TM2 domain-containing membrane protein YozV
MQSGSSLGRPASCAIGGGDRSAGPLRTADERENLLPFEGYAPQSAIAKRKHLAISVPTPDPMECTSCGAQIADNLPRCPYCDAAIASIAPTARPTVATMGGPVGTDVSSTKMKAGICGILLGAFGVHKFILGYHLAGLIMLGVTVLSGFALAFIPGLLGLIEGIIYLTKSDQAFEQTYIANKKLWL